VDEQVTETEDTSETVTTKGPTRQHKRALVRRLQKLVKRSKTAEKRYKKRGEKCIDGYFGQQWDEEDEQTLKDRGQPVITINRLRPTWKLVHGLVVGQPVDLMAKPVGKNDDKLAEVGTAALKAVNNQNDYPSVRSRVYWWAGVYGLGVAMVGLQVRSKDPRQEPVQYRVLDPREFGWDPDSRELNLSDAGWVRWSRKALLEKAQQEFKEYAPHLAKVAKDADGKTDGTDEVETWDGSPWFAPLRHSEWKSNSDWNAADDEEDKAGARYVTLHEVWEKTNERATVAEFASGDVRKIDFSKPEDVALLAQPDVVRYYETDLPCVYYHIICGPLLLKSEKSPYTHNEFPFAVCWHERDHHGDPYSFLQDLLDPQREINHRRSKALHEMTNPNVRVSDAMLSRMGLDADGFAELWHKGGGIFIGAPGDVEIYERAGLAANQIQLMQDSKAEIQSVSGANDDLMGYDSTSKSGIAKQTQMAQGAMMQRPNEANLRLFDKMCGNLALQLIQQAHTDEWVVRITDNLGKDEYVSLNQTTVDPETGMVRRINDITQAKYEVEIEPTNWTPTQRQAAAQNIAALAEGEADPVVRMALKRAALEVDDMPGKGAVLEILDNAVQAMMGGNQQQPDPAQMEAAQRMQQAEVGKAEAGAAKASADAVKAEAQAMQAQTQMMFPQPVAIPGEVA
jgi:hypothetical protein